MKLLVFDTETTGLLQPQAVPLEKQPKIIELGLLVLEDGIEKTSANWLINPMEPITEEITKITGLRDEDLAGAPQFKDLLREIAPHFAACDALVAHNAPFDVGMLTNELARCGELEGFVWPAETICTAQEFTHVFGYRPKLTELFERFTGRPLAQTHRAIDDVRALVEVLLAEGSLI